MAIPNTKLVIKPIDWDNLTLGQFAVLAGRTDDIMDIREFLVQTSNWPQREINRLTFKDMGEVMRMVNEEVERQVSPNGSTPSSEPGPAGEAK